MKKFLLLFSLIFSCNLFSTTVTKTVNDLTNEHDWIVSSGNSVGTLATSFDLDSMISISTTGDANCGSIWGTTTKDWRLYQAKNGNLIITSKKDTIQTIKLVFSVSNGGCLKDASNQTISSGSVVGVNDLTTTFVVGNTGTKTNGQVKITSFEVTYGTKFPTDTVSIDTISSVTFPDTNIKVYDALVNGYDAYKVGTSGDDGALLVDVERNTVSVSFYAAAWKGSEGSISILAADNIEVSDSVLALVADDGITGNSPFTLAETNVSVFYHKLTLDNVNVDSKIALISGSVRRFVVWNIEKEIKSDISTDLSTIVDKKVVKCFNGKQVVFIKNGIVYNVLGQKL